MCISKPACVKTSDCSLTSHLPLPHHTPAGGLKPTQRRHFGSRFAGCLFTSRQGSQCFVVPLSVFCLGMSPPVTSCNVSCLCGLSVAVVFSSWSLRQVGAVVKGQYCWSRNFGGGDCAPYMSGCLQPPCVRNVTE